MGIKRSTDSDRNQKEAPENSERDFHIDASKSRIIQI